MFLNTELDKDQVMNSFQDTLDLEVFAKCKGTLEQLAKGMATKNWKVLQEILSHGKGWNDNSKKAFCAALGKTESLTKKSMNAYIAYCCGISVEYMKASNEYELASLRLKDARSELMTYQGAREGIEKIENIIREYQLTRVEVHNRKSYAVGDNSSSMLPLEQKAVIQFVKALFKEKECCDVLLVEGDIIASKHREVAVQAIGGYVRNPDDAITWLDSMFEDGDHILSTINGTTYLSKKGESNGYPLLYEAMVVYARTKITLHV